MFIFPIGPKSLVPSRVDFAYINTELQIMQTSVMCTRQKVWWLIPFQKWEPSQWTQTWRSLRKLVDWWLQEPQYRKRKLIELLKVPVCPDSGDANV